MRKRILPALMALVMVLGMLPMTVLADDAEGSLQGAGTYDGYSLKAWVDDAKTYGNAILEGHSEDTGKITLGEKTDAEIIIQLKNAALNVLGAQAAWETIETATDEQTSAKADLDTLVAGFAGIENLDMSDMGLTDVNFLEVFTGLKKLNISGNANVTDLNALEFCTDLEVLDASNCGLENTEDKSGQATNGITGLAFCTSLKSLNLSGNSSLEDINALATCTELTTLDLSGNSSLEDINALATCTKLTTLDLSGNTSLGDINALAGVQGNNAPLAQLETLTLDGTAVTTLAPLAGCTGLSSLSATNLELTDIGPADLLAGLNDLTLTDTTLKAAADGSNLEALANAAKIIAAEHPGSGLTVTDNAGTAYYLITVTPTTGGTIEVSASSASEGTEITVTATPASSYEGGTITVTKASGDTVTVTDGKFTMPAENVTVSASFTAVAPVDPVVPETPVTNADPTLTYVDRTQLTGADKENYFGGKLTITNPNTISKTYLVAIGDPSIKVGEKNLSITYVVTLSGKANRQLSCQNVFQVWVAEIEYGTDVTTEGLTIPDENLKLDWTPVTELAG